MFTVRVFFVSSAYGPARFSHIFFITVVTFDAVYGVAFTVGLRFVLGMY